MHVRTRPGDVPGDDQRRDDEHGHHGPGRLGPVEEQYEKDTVEDDLAGYKAQAKAVAAALDTHVEGLDGVEGTEVGKLRATLTKAAGNWKKAANAADADAFYLAYDPAFTDIDPNKSVAARKELGLATTVPADEAEVWAG